MPTNILDIDTSFPDTRGKEQAQINQEILNHLFLLQEQLRYMFGNLGVDNFNDASFQEIQTIITDPIYSRLSDDEGNLSSLSATAQGLLARIEDADGNITALAILAEGLEKSVSDAEGNILTLTETAKGLSSSVEGLDGMYTLLLQTVEGFTFMDENGKVWINNGSINLTGAITFSDLDSSTQNAINNRGVSESEVHTIIEKDLVLSPKIAGGKFMNLAQDVWIEIVNSDTSGVWAGFSLMSERWWYEEPIFGVYDADFNDVSFSAKGSIFLMVRGNTDPSAFDGNASPRGTWDFSEATTKGLYLRFA